MSDFVVLTATLREIDGLPGTWTEVGSRATEADAMKFAQSLRGNDISVRIFGVHDWDYKKLLAEAAAPAALFAVAVVDKLGLHTTLTSDGWTHDRQQAQAIADARSEERRVGKECRSRW